MLRNLANNIKTKAHLEDREMKADNDDAAIRSSNESSDKFQARSV